MTESDVGRPLHARQDPENPADALAAVIESTAALARAELRLAAAEARAWLLRLGSGLVLLWLSLSLVQVSVLVLALTPVLPTGTSWARITAMLAVGLLPTTITAVLAARALRRATRDVRPERAETTDATALPLGAQRHSGEAG